MRTDDRYPDEEDEHDPYNDPFWVPPPDPDRPGWLPPLAGRPRRLLARIIDLVIATGAFYALVLTVELALIVAGADLRPEAFDTDTAKVLLGVAYMSALFMYDWPFLALCGATPGKLLLGIRVCRVADDGPIAGGRAAARAAAFAVMGVTSCLGLLNMLWPLWDKPLHQALHDKIAGTLALRPERPAHEDPPVNMTAYVWTGPTQTPGASSWT